MQDKSSRPEALEGSLSRPAKPPLRFASFVLDLDACTLARDSGETIALTRGEFALLRMFVGRPGRVISRDALLDAFADRRFEPFNRSVDILIGKLRRKIEADPKSPRLIVTVPGEGYRFDGLRLRAPEIAKLAHADSASKRQSASPPRLSIVVLPFANIGRDPEQEYFADGVTESLTTDLSRMRGAVVIARNTAFAYKGKPIDAKAMGRELNVRYILEGSVQRAGARMRVNVQLIDAESGSHLWAERFDKPVADLFDMKDEIVARLAGALNAQLVAAGARRAEQSPNPDSMDLYFQGLAWLHKGPTPDHLARARHFFDRALSASPDNVDALIGSAATHAVEAASSLTPDPVAAFVAAEAKLTSALSLAPNHTQGQMWLGLVEIWTRRAAQGIARCERALELDRNLAHVHALIGYGKLFIGRSNETESHIIEALRLSPRDPRAFAWMSFAGMSKIGADTYEQAVEWLRQSIEANRNFPHSHCFLASAFAHLGRVDEARLAVKAGLALNHAYCISRDRCVWTAVSNHPTFLAQLELYHDGVRKAGAPEG
jgi:TolB-like protein